MLNVVGKVIGKYPYNCIMLVIISAPSGGGGGGGVVASVAVANVFIVCSV